MSEGWRRSKAKDLSLEDPALALEELMEREEVRQRCWSPNGIEQQAEELSSEGRCRPLK